MQRAFSELRQVRKEATVGRIARVTWGSLASFFHSSHEIISYDPVSGKAGGNVTRSLSSYL